MPTLTAHRGLRFTALLLGGALLLLWAVLVTRETMTAATEQALQRASLGSAYVQRILDAQSSVLDTVDELIKGRDWSDIESSEQLHAQLSELDRGKSFTLVLAIINPQGRMVMSSQLFPVNQDFSQREHVKALRESAEGIYVGPRLRLQNNKIDALMIARRARAGPPGAILAAPIPVDVITGFFSSLAVGESDAASLNRTDGWALVRRRAEQPPLKLGSDLPAMTEVVGRQKGVYTTVAVSDGVRRLYAFSRVEGYPLIFYYGTAMADVFQAGLWKFAIGAAFVGLVAVLLFLTARAFEQRWQTEIARRMELEEAVQERTVELQRMVARSEALVKEVHHRIKNNLAMVSSMLRLQARKDPAAAPAIRETMMRMDAIAAMHTLFYRSQDVGQIRFADLLGELVSDIKAATATLVDIEVTADDTVLALDQATPLALICNELVTNAVKHAFPSGRGTIRIRFLHDQDSVVLEVSDDGVGHPGEGKSGSLGMKLVDAFVEQLGGELKICQTQGTTVRVTMDPSRWHQTRVG